MQKLLLLAGSVLAALAVILGAFGAHGLKKVVSADTLTIYQTGVQYQMYHALALLLTGILSERFASGLLNYAGIFFIAGIVLFSGSLYLIVSFHAMNKPVSTGIGILTPIGGLFFIVGWLILIFSLLRK